MAKNLKVGEIVFVDDELMGKMIRCRVRKVDDKWVWVMSTACDWMEFSPYFSYCRPKREVHRNDNG